MPGFHIDRNKDPIFRINLAIDDVDDVRLYLQCFAPQKSSSSKEGYEWKPCSSPLALDRESPERSQWIIRRARIAEHILDITYPFKMLLTIHDDSSEAARAKYYGRLALGNYIITGKGHSSREQQLAITNEGLSQKKGRNSEYWYIWFLDARENYHPDIRNIWEINQSLIDFRSLSESEIERAFSLWNENALFEVSSSRFPRRPPPNKNNIWYYESDDDTVFVFVHGMNSDSCSAWYYVGAGGPEDGEYWPDLVEKDRTTGNAGVFLGGYYASSDAGPLYNFEQAARHLFADLARKRPSLGAVLDRKNIIFVAHSAGGIVVREILKTFVGKFQNKKVGLLLVASPSRGSIYAKYLGLSRPLERHELSMQLRENAEYLENLDRDFRKLIEEGAIPNLVGRELVEHRHSFRFLNRIPILRIIPIRPIVEYRSAANYFENPILIHESDHHSIAKPNNIDHRSHVFLCDLYNTILGNGD